MMNVLLNLLLRKLKKEGKTKKSEYPVIFKKKNLKTKKSENLTVDFKKFEILKIEKSDRRFTNVRAYGRVLIVLSYCSDFFFCVHSLRANISHCKVKDILILIETKTRKQGIYKTLCDG